MIAKLQYMQNVQFIECNAHLTTETRNMLVKDVLKAIKRVMCYGTLMTKWTISTYEELISKRG